MPQKTLKFSYPQVTIDGTYGTQVTIPLKRNNLIQKYLGVVTLGTLSGGTSPAWTVSGSNPLITHVTLTADNDVLLDMDTDMLGELVKLGFLFSPDGLTYRIDMTDIDFTNSKNVDGTEFPSYAYNNITLTLTVAPLASVTSGSPTGTSGTVFSLVEYASVYSATIPLVKVKKLQNTYTLNTTGLSQIVPSPFYTLQGAFKMVLYKVLSGSTPSDTAVSKLKLLINDSNVIYDEYYNTKKADDNQAFNISLDTGFVADVYMIDSKDPSQMLVLLNPNITRVIEQDITTTTSPVTVKGVKIMYVPS
jgi:hypothetical protein